MALKLSEAGITQEGGTTLSWSGLKGLRKALWSQQLEIRGQEGRILLDKNIGHDFLLRFYQEWRALYPEEAKKNAFDYVDVRRGFAWILLVVSLIFSLGYGLIASNDAREQMVCTAALKQGATLAEATVLKVRKKRAGHYIVKLSFQTADGTVITGGEQLLEKVDSMPKATIPVVYAEQTPKCWSIVTEDQAEKVNWPQRRFFAAYLMMLGLFFIGAGIFGAAVAIQLLREKRLYTKEISDFFGFQL